MDQIAGHAGCRQGPGGCRAVAAAARRNGAPDYGRVRGRRMQRNASTPCMRGPVKRLPCMQACSVWIRCAVCQPLSKRRCCVCRLQPRRAWHHGMANHQRMKRPARSPL
eukprot:35252-Chlamydomonas_euryale.AAC.8